MLVKYNFTVNIIIIAWPMLTGYLILQEPYDNIHNTPGCPITGGPDAQLIILFLEPKVVLENAILE